MQKITVQFELNGRPCTVTAVPETSLLDVLRGDLGLTGAKRGCDHEGLCGACTVLIDGKSRRACITAVGTLAGARVETIEGLERPDGTLHPLQQAFIDFGAVQCGFCTPGLILSARALLYRNANPSREDVIAALKGNLCRCTGYAQVIDAVLAAAASLRGEPYSLPYDESQVIGKGYRRQDSAGKVTGRFKFLDDTARPEAAFIKTVRSPHHSARILGIDAGAALAMDGVEAVLTAADIPGVKGVSDHMNTANVSSADQLRIAVQPEPVEAVEPVLAQDVVRWLGEPVALVVARDEETARRAAAVVAVDYEPLEPVLTAREAAAQGAARIHPFGNVYETFTQKNGSPWLDLPAGEVTVQTQIATASQAHFPLEPAAALAFIDADGRLVAEGPTHEAFARQKQIALVLGIPTERVRVIVSQMGGSFGGRHYFWPLAAVALPAFLLQRPVKMIFDREEEFTGTLKRHPVDAAVEISAAKDGRFTALKARAVGNAGPYGNTVTIARFLVECGIGPYQWGAVDFESTFYHTNGPNGGPFRGYGMPQGSVCVETCIDALARKLEIDPLELRRTNAVDRFPVTAWGQPFDEPVGFLPVLDSIQPFWQELLAETARLNAANRAEDRVYQAGFSGGWYQFGKFGGLSATAQAGIDEKGRITIYYEGYEAGTGLGTLLAQIACEELGVPRELVTLVANDTGRTLASSIYGACKDVYWVGGAVRDACRILRGQMFATGAAALRLPPGGEWAAGAQGIVERASGSRLTYREVREIWDELKLPDRFTGTQNLADKLPPRPAEFDLSGHFTCGAAAAQILLERSTGRVRVLRLVIAQDVGRVINPADLRGQVYGGAMLELSSTLYEEYIPGETVTLKKYPVARSSDLPEIVFLPVEVPGTFGPYGAKGLGESLGYIRPAIMNAVTRAAGVPLESLPFTPARIRAALAAGKD